jgi:hypothetical protein
MHLKPVELKAQTRMSRSNEGDRPKGACDPNPPPPVRVRKSYLGKADLDDHELIAWPSHLHLGQAARQAFAT